FSRSQLEQDVEKLQEAVEEASQDETEPLPAVNPLLASPRETMRTFLGAFGHWEEGGREQAILTLDLSDMDASVRELKGEELAIQLKQVFDRDRFIVVQEIPNAPDGPTYVHLTDDTDPTGQRRIEIVPVLVEETGEAADWKFSVATIAVLPEIYAAYIDREVVEGVRTDTPTVFSLVMRDWIDKNLPFLMNRPVLLENWQWLGLVLVILFGMIVSRIVAFVFLFGVRSVFRRENLLLDSKLERGFMRPIRVAIMARVWLWAISLLGLPADALVFLRTVSATVSAVAAVWAVYRLVDILGEYLGEKARRSENKFDDIVVPLVVRSLKVFAVAFGVVFVAEVNDWNYGAALAGVGLGGLAFALAAQDTISNVFGSLTILFDKPFRIGDWVTIGDVDGTVESVGIRSTRIRTFYNSLVTVPNSKLINAVVDNYGERKYRRIKTMLSLTYDTPPETIESFCEGIRELIRRHPYTRKDYFHVYLNEFSDSSLNVLLYCFHECPDWSTELRERQRLYLDILRLAERLGVSFAFPTQTLYVRKEETPAQANSTAGLGDPLARGRDTASSIVDEFLGGVGTIPPPVIFDPAPRQKQGPSDDSD
ncbi:MAG: mechanosensitive ion channel family protein, partial [Candidatus Hydrogenedentes bacterium]|nr:mechanosensitive ion channel family protein [Candidatus Hydrogenedentota bacterium]